MITAHSLHSLSISQIPRQLNRHPVLGPPAPPRTARVNEANRREEDASQYNLPHFIELPRSISSLITRGHSLSLSHSSCTSSRKPVLQVVVRPQPEGHHPRRAGHARRASHAGRRPHAWNGTNEPCDIIGCIERNILSRLKTTHNFNIFFRRRTRGKTSVLRHLLNSITILR